MSLMTDLGEGLILDIQAVVAAELKGDDLNISLVNGSLCLTGERAKKAWALLMQQAANGDRYFRMDAATTRAATTSETSPTSQPSAASKSPSSRKRQRSTSRDPQSDQASRPVPQYSKRRSAQRPSKGPRKKPRA